MIQEFMFLLHGTFFLHFTSNKLHALTMQENLTKQTVKHGQNKYISVFFVFFFFASASIMFLLEDFNSTCMWISAFLL